MRRRFEQAALVQFFVDPLDARSQIVLVDLDADEIHVQTRRRHRTAAEAQEGIHRTLDSVHAVEPHAVFGEPGTWRDGAGRDRGT